MTAQGQPDGRGIPRWIAWARLALLVVIAASLVAGAVGDSPQWLNTVMAVVALGIGAALTIELLRDPPARSSPIAQLWKRSDRAEQRDHTGDWW